MTGIGVVLAIIPFFPASLEGNWHGSFLKCGCDSHNFLRFADGKFLYVRENHPPPEWVGNYEKTGWGRYKVTMFLGGGEGVAKPGVIFLRPLAPDWGPRDFSTEKCDAILQDPEQRWVIDYSCRNVMVLTEAGELTYFVSGHKKSLSQMEKYLNRLKTDNLLGEQPFVVYSESDVHPTALTAKLSELEIGFEMRSIKALEQGM